MPPSLRPCSAVVMDIEGTTSAARFVYDVLFPYARARLDDWITQHGDDPATAAAVAEAARELGVDPEQTDAVVAGLRRWIDDDVKAASLKALQGLIWEEGYAAGELHAHFFDDVAPALTAWRDAGLLLVVYSSGSVTAQKSLFRNAHDGDLDSLIDANFDITTAGPKREPDSYRRIAAALGVPADRLIFLSDIQAELDAAATAGWQVVGVRRPGEEQATAEADAVPSFAEVMIKPA